MSTLPPSPRTGPKLAPVPEQAGAPASQEPQGGQGDMRDLIRFVLAEVKTEQTGPPPPPGPSRQSAPLLVAITLGGAFLVQRGEATRELVVESARKQAEISAQLTARQDAAEKDRLEIEAEGDRGNDTLREALWILSEDSRMLWDAMDGVHENTKPPGAPSLRKTSTPQRLTSLRDDMGVASKP